MLKTMTNMPESWDVAIASPQEKSIAVTMYNDRKISND